MSESAPTGRTRRASGLLVPLLLEPLPLGEQRFGRLREYPSALGDDHALHEAVEVTTEGRPVVWCERSPDPACLHGVPGRLQVALPTGCGSHPVRGCRTRWIAAELLRHAITDLLIHDLPLEVGPRPGVPVEGARPPIEHTLATQVRELL